MLIEHYCKYIVPIYRKKHSYTENTILTFQLHGNRSISKDYKLYANVHYINYSNLKKMQSKTHNIQIKYNNEKYIKSKTNFI